MVGALGDSSKARKDISHARPWREILRELAVDKETGLGEEDARRRLEKFGPNALQRGSREGPLRLLWRQINNPLIYVLLGSAALAVALGKTADGTVVLGVVVLNAVVGFVQEYRAGKAIEALMDMVALTATVVRGGVRKSVPTAELVPGDVVVLGSGDKVPADMRLISARNLRVEEAPLTGESAPVEKGVEPLAEETLLADRLNMVFGGTLVVHGTGFAVVVGTGSDTELGRISSMLSETSRIETPLTLQLATVGRWLTAAITSVAVLLFVVGLLRGYPLVDATLAAIALAVAAIPEGLPAIITIALAIGVRRMARRRAVVRRLPAVETLGSTTVICTDKTGTLTRNEMTVQELWTPAKSYDLGGAGYALEGKISQNGEKLAAVLPDARELLLAGVLCNDVRLDRDGEDWRITGDPTEGALIVAAQKLGVNVQDERMNWPRRDAIPFESERRYMATLHEVPEDGPVVYLKGAPEVVVRRCVELSGGGALNHDRALDQADQMAARGMRVLALAARRPPSPLAGLDEEDAGGGFALLGFQGMMDPPRPEAMEAVEACRRAGITVKMITGDHKGTARTIGERLGLLDPEGAALTGNDLGGLSDEELRKAAKETNVFARVAPEHKLRLVRSLQAQREVAAMTGDGVNDAPALKQADIGVAMGITGTDVSKESADIVLTDDNFASIAAAVEEGRRVYDNLIKALAFVLPTNIGEALIILLAVMFFPVVGSTPLLPMLPTQILWINLVATVALALPLAFEAMEPDVMRRPPRDPEKPVLSRFVLIRTTVVALLMTAGAIGVFLVRYYGEAARDAPAGLALGEAQTAAVTTVILFQILYLFYCRSLKSSVLGIGLWTNPWIYAGIGALLLLQLGFVYLPFMNALFGSAPLGVGDWIGAFAVACIVIPVIEAEKWWRGRQTDRAPAEKPDREEIP